MSAGREPVDPGAEAYLSPHNYHTLARSLGLEERELECASEAELEFAGWVWSYASGPARLAWLRAAGRSPSIELLDGIDRCSWRSVSLGERERLADAMIGVRALVDAIDESKLHRTCKREVHDRKSPDGASEGRR